MLGETASWFFSNRETIGLRKKSAHLFKRDFCKAERSEGGNYIYLSSNRAYFLQYGSADLGGISVGLGARYSDQKNSTFRMWAICQTIVIFLNTEEQMLDIYKSNYYPIWTSVTDITFTHCFFGVNL
jgi:hypothetical protein